MTYYSKSIAAMVALGGVFSSAHAGPRSSASYGMATEVVDAGGQRATSAAYSNDGSVSGSAGVSTVTAPAETAKSGYVGQLFEITSLVVNGASASVPETATVQLGAWQALDDASFLAVDPVTVAWSVVGGPVTNLSTAGVATAAAVYENTPATVQGSFGGLAGLYNLTVLNTLPDNLGSYAGDGIDDAWQVQYFGLNNPQAAPGANPFHTGLNNLGAWAFGLSPTVGGGSLIASGAVLTKRGLPDTSVPQTQNGVDYRAVFGRRKNYQTYGLSYGVEFSDLNLTVWEPNTAVPVKIAEDGEIEAMTVPYPLVLSTGKKAQFFRVRVTGP